MTFMELFQDFSDEVLEGRTYDGVLAKAVADAAEEEGRDDAPAWRALASARLRPFQVEEGEWGWREQPLAEEQAAPGGELHSLPWCWFKHLRSFRERTLGATAPTMYRGAWKVFSCPDAAFWGLVEAIASFEEAVAEAVAWEKADLY